MRPIVLAACVLGVAVSASAQSAERPFLSGEPTFYATNRELTGVGTQVGFDLTAGTRSWKGLQPIFQGGRLIDVHPADLIRQSIAPPFARHTSTWYGAAGARYLPPRVWKFQPYAEATTGAAHMNSEVETATSPVHVTRVVPVTAVGVGAELRLGQHFTIDAGYRRQGFFGDANVMRVGPRLGFGVRF